MLKRLTEISFLLLVFSLPFVNLPFLFSSGFRFQLTEPLFILVSALFVISVFAGDSKIARGKIYWFAGAYLFFIVISAAFSQNPGASMFKAAGIAYLAGIALLAFNIVRDEAAMRRVVKAWLAATSVVAVFSVLVLILFYIDRDLGLVRFGLSHYGTFPQGNYPRIQSLFSNPNMLAHYLGISWVMLLLALEKDWIDRKAALVTGGLILIAALFTLSPGIGVFFFCTGVWLLARNESGSRRLMPAALIAVSVLFIAVTAVKFDKDFSPASEPSARVMTWSSAVSTFSSHPLTGKGVGTGAAYARYGEQRLTDAHNIFLNVAAESGIGAVAALAVFGVWLTLKGFRKGDLNAPARALAIAFAGAFFYQGMTGSFEDGRHLWMLAGILAAADSGSGEAADG